MKTALAAMSLLSAIVLIGCAGHAARDEAAAVSHEPVASRHAGDDDLLTAGLGAAGLRSPLPPAFAAPESPTAVELRRRAVWSNWRGIADLAPGGGYGELYGSLAPVPGSEYHALAKLPGARQPHRLMLQVPDDFDAKTRCVIVAASSGSRGIYGAIALAGSWGLSHRCAVSYTDKGAGTTYVDVATGIGNELDGTRSQRPGAGDFVLQAEPSSNGIATKHAHSGDNPEADWGRHVRQAAEFALQVLNSTRASEPTYTFDNTMVIATGVSNGGGAVLRAAELPGRWLDGLVAISPNILPANGGRPLYDYASEAALYLPCALDATAFDAAPFARPGGGRPAGGALRCASLHAAGLLQDQSPESGPEQAHAYLRRQGWSDEAMAAGALSTSFDLWRSVLATYASSYSRTPATAMPCGYRFLAVDAKGVRAPTGAEQAAWWSDASGIPPGAGVGIADSLTAGADPAWPGVQCLRSLWSAGDVAGERLREGVAATRAALPRKGLPILIAHGADDGLVPAAFSGGAYARWSQQSGRQVRYWRVSNAQHFDAFLGVPAMAARYVPMLPYAYRALDAMWATLRERAPLPGDAVIESTPRTSTPGGLAPLTAENLGRTP